MRQTEPSGLNIWNSPDIVSNFRHSRPSAALLEFARELASGGGAAADTGHRTGHAEPAETARAGGEVDRSGHSHTAHLRILDIGCGAGRNAVPLAQAGHSVTGVDIAGRMIDAAHEHAVEAGVASRCTFLTGRMDALPLSDPEFDLIVAHGVWNLAVSEETFRAAVTEATRLSRTGTALFVTTFSRNTLPPEAQPVAGTRFVFTDFNGSPQCFLREDELRDELAAAGFRVAPDRPVVERNRPAAWEQWREPGQSSPERGRRLNVAGPKRPVLYEGVWYRQAQRR